MFMTRIQTDKDQREITSHGSAQLPLQINHDHMYSFYNRYIHCHWHEELEIPVLLKGHVRYQLKDKAFELLPGEGLVINSCVPHSAVSLSEDEPLLLTTIVHPALLYGTPASSIYQKLLYPYLNTPSLSGISLPAGGADIMREIDALSQEASFGHELRIKSLLCSLFFDLLSPYEDLLTESRPLNSEALTRLQILLDAIHEDYAEPLSLSALASRISVSREGCCRFFKKMTGKTISEYLKDYRISQSILLLQDDRYSIEQVARLVGFGNSGHFSTDFARRMNCTPCQYRQHFQNKS